MRSPLGPGRAIAALAVFTAATACAHQSRLQLIGPGVPPPVPPASRVFVMPAFVVGTARPGNVGRDLLNIQPDVTAKLLAIVRERCPDSDVARTDRLIAFPMARYRAAIPAGSYLPHEFSAVTDAYDRGAAFLLVPAITEWTQARTDDPIGAFMSPHNSVTIDLRLMRLQPPALVAQASFHNRARLTLNQPAMRLVDDRFRRMVVQLFGG